MSDTKTQGDQNRAVDGPESTPPRKKWIRAAKACVAVLVIIGLFMAARSAIEQWKAETGKVAEQIATIDRQIQSEPDAERRSELNTQRAALLDSAPGLGNLRWDYIALAALLYALGLVPPAFVLRQALVSLGEQPRRDTVVAAQLLGHAGKYVPGKAMVIVLRAGALANDGVRGIPATVSVFLETFLMMAVGAALAGLITIWLPVPTWITIGAVLAALGAGLPTTPPILRRVAERIAKGNHEAHSERIGWRLFAAGWGWSMLSWLLIGASFTCLVAAIPESTPLPPLIPLLGIATASICLAVVAGFASLIPGGAGVRELVLTTVLGVSVGPVRGILAALAARIVYILVETLLAGLSWLWLRRRRP